MCFIYSAVVFTLHWFILFCLAMPSQAFPCLFQSFCLLLLMLLLLAYLQFESNSTLGHALKVFLFFFCLLIGERFTSLCGKHAVSCIKWQSPTDLQSELFKGMISRKGWTFVWWLK
ncbi:hypothetical protein XENOCAPTIV_003500, partial [Xenoophorus captivus]